MTKVSFPYGKGTMTQEFGEELLGVLTSSIEQYVATDSPEELVRKAMEAPEGGVCLRDLAKGKDNVVIIASDHTRPVPSKLIIPPMLAQIREGNPNAKITILIATGCHRETTKEELIDKFGPEIVEKETIVIHDCLKDEDFVNIGTLPSGGQCVVNRLAVEADLLVAEGFIEPHFFAGFSGGRKSVLPGIAGRTTVLANHCSEFIAHPRSRTGILEGNPIHEDMLWAAKQAKLCYIVNVVLNGHKEVIYAVAGDMELAHRKGTDFLSGLCGAKAIPADIAITTNAGYPLDQNMYQSPKGMSAGEATVKQGGVVIMLASSTDGFGGEHFYRQLAQEKTVDALMADFLARDREHTVPDQWQAQILVRVLQKASVIYISEMDDDLVRQVHMIPAHSLEEALAKAKKILQKENPTVVAIPDGISVMVLE